MQLASFIIALNLYAPGFKADWLIAVMQGKADFILSIQMALIMGQWI